MRFLRLLPLCVVLALQSPAQRGPGRPGNPAQAPPPGQNQAAQSQTPAAPANPPKVEEKVSKTQHTVTIGGQTVAYTATAGTMVLKKEDGTPTASMFYIAYVKDGV